MPRGPQPCGTDPADRPCAVIACLDKIADRQFLDPHLPARHLDHGARDETGRAEISDREMRALVHPGFRRDHAIRQHGPVARREVATAIGGVERDTPDQDAVQGDRIADPDAGDIAAVYLVEAIRLDKAIIVGIVDLHRDDGGGERNRRGAGIEVPRNRLIGINRH